MTSGFALIDQDIAGSTAPLREARAVASTQYYQGDAGVITNGHFTRSASQTDKPAGIFNSMSVDKVTMRPATKNLSTSGSTLELISYNPAKGSRLRYKTLLTGVDAPPINGTAANSNAVTTTVKVTASGSSNDYVGGTVYASNGESRRISADSVSGGVHTFTVTRAFSRAITTGDTIIVVPFGAGIEGVKLSSTDPAQGISTATADKSGGYVDIQEVDLSVKVPYAVVSFQA